MSDDPRDWSRQAIALLTAGRESRELRSRTFASYLLDSEEPLESAATKLLVGMSNVAEVAMQLLAMSSGRRLDDILQEVASLLEHSGDD